MRLLALAALARLPHLSWLPGTPGLVGRRQSQLMLRAMLVTIV